MLSEISNNLVEYINQSDFSLLFLLISFLGGLIASISPCSLGVLPLIVGYVGGYGDDNKLKTFIQLCFFVAGLGITMTIFGILCVLGGKVFSGIAGQYWILFLASLILVMGLNLLGLIELNMPPVVKRIPKGSGTSLILYPMLIGMLFAFASSPCSTPILAGIMSFAVLTKNIFQAALMLFLFSLGQGIIIILAGVFTSFLKGLKSFASISSVLMKISGVILILGAFLIYFKLFAKFVC